MSKPLVLVFPHDLGTEEARRRLDRRTDWAVRKLQDYRIQVSLSDWVADSRGFTATAVGQKIGGTLNVGDDSIRLETSLPLALRAFAPVIEIVAKKYAGELLSPAKA